MERNADQRRQHDDAPFEYAAVQFLRDSGRSVEEVSAELGLSPVDLRTWQRKYPFVATQKAVKPLNHVGRLQAENKALRDEIRHLKVQWDVLKTTLGILSSSVCHKENRV